MPRPTSTAVQRTGELLRQGAASLVLREAFFRVRRFDDFQRLLGVSRSVLARTLKSLVAAGVLERRRYQRRPDRYEYVLTEAGLALYPVFLAMKQWGDEWLGSDGPEITLTHLTCEHACDPRMTCDHCGGIIKAKEMAYTVTPTARAEPHAEDPGVSIQEHA